jgi:hypothetical protein
MSWKGKTRKEGQEEKHTKLAGDPPCRLSTSIVAIARPAPFTRHPTLPSSLMKLRPYYLLAFLSFSSRGTSYENRRDRRETYLGSLYLLGVLLGGVTELEDVFLSEIGIVVETEFGIHTVCQLCP